jgi:poly(3-hydroxyalkanoate) synthetase
MGKNRTIKIIGRLIGGMTAHKILERHTNKIESLNHLRTEVDNYRENVFSFINEFNWSQKDKEAIREESLKNLKNELKQPHFNDVKFPEDEPEKLINETLKEILI